MKKRNEQTRGGKKNNTWNLLQKLSSCTTKIYWKRRPPRHAQVVSTRREGVSDASSPSSPLHSTLRIIFLAQASPPREIRRRCYRTSYAARWCVTVCTVRLCCGVFFFLLSFSSAAYILRTITKGLRNLCVSYVECDSARERCCSVSALVLLYVQSVFQ